MLSITNPIPSGRIKLVVFDLDGTLIDSRRDLATAVNAMLGEMGRPALPDKVVAEYVGDGAGMLVRRALGDPSDEAIVEEGVERFLACYRRHMLDHTYVYDGVFEALAALRKIPSGAKAPSSSQPRSARLKPCPDTKPMRSKGPESGASEEWENHPSGAKAPFSSGGLTDGLKPVPFKNLNHSSGAEAPSSSSQPRSAPFASLKGGLLKPCPDTKPMRSKSPESGASPGERKFAVLTNKPVNPARRICEALGLNEHFFQIYGGNSFGTKKPDPEGLRALMREAGASPDETVMVGDSVVDVLTARNAGTFVIGCRYGLSSHTLETVVSDCMVDAPSEWVTALGAAVQKSKLSNRAD